jgi:hypothetical protein
MSCSYSPSSSWEQQQQHSSAPSTSTRRRRNNKMIKSSRRSTMKTASTLIASSILSFLLLSTSTTLAQDPQETLALYEPPDGQVMFGAWVQTEWVHTLYSECIVDAVAAAVLSVCSLCVTPTLCLAPYLFNMLVLGWKWESE